VSCGGIKALMGWHKPEVAFDLLYLACIEFESYVVKLLLAQVR
jgi:hypothetical protein